MPEVCPERNPKYWAGLKPVDWPIRPLRVLSVIGAPEDSVIIYAPPADGTFPGHPDWVPLERRCAKLVLDS